MPLLLPPEGAMDVLPASVRTTPSALTVMVHIPSDAVAVSPLTATVVLVTQLPLSSLGEQPFSSTSTYWPVTSSSADLTFLKVFAVASAASTAVGSSDSSMISASRTDRSRLLCPLIFKYDPSCSFCTAVCPRSGQAGPFFHHKATMKNPKPLFCKACVKYAETEKAACPNCVGRRPCTTAARNAT